MEFLLVNREGLSSASSGYELSFKRQKSLQGAKTLHILPYKFWRFVMKYTCIVVVGAVKSIVEKQMKWESTANNVQAKGFNPGLIVLLVVGGLLLAFVVGNYALYMYAQRTLPPKKKKPISKKKLKRERMKQGISAPGE